MNRTIRNVRWGVGWGVGIAGVLSVFVLLSYIVHGRASFDRLGTSVWAVILFYFAAAVVAGGLVGMLRPIATSRGKYILVAVVAFVPVSMGVTVTLYGMRWPPGWLFFTGGYS